MSFCHYIRNHISVLKQVSDAAWLWVSSFTNCRMVVLTSEWCDLFIWTVTTSTIHPRYVCNLGRTGRGKKFLGWVCWVSVTVYTVTYVSSLISLAITTRLMLIFSRLKRCLSESAGKQPTTEQQHCETTLRVLRCWQWQILSCHNIYINIHMRQIHLSI